MQTTRNYTITSRITADGTREWVSTLDPTSGPERKAAEENKPNYALLTTFIKKLTVVNGDSEAIYFLVHDLARKGSKDDLLGFLKLIIVTNSPAILGITPEINMTDEHNQTLLRGKTSLIFECGEQHPEVLTTLLREYEFKPEFLNFNVTCYYDGERYREIGDEKPQQFTVIRYGNENFSYKKPRPTNLVQLALAKQKAELLQELFKYKGINLKGTMLFAFRVQNYSCFEDYSHSYREKSERYAKDFAFLKQATSLLEVALQQQGVKLTEVEKVLVAIFKKENDVQQWNDFYNPRHFLEELDFLEQIEEKPAQTPAAIRHQLSHALRNRYRHASQHLLARVDLLDGIPNFADLLTIALESEQPDMAQKLWNHPKLTDAMLSAVGYEGNTLEVLLKHYAKEGNGDNHTKKILQSMMLDLMERGVPPEDRNKRCITDFMSELTWSNDSNLQLRSVLKPYTQKYECGPRACAWVTQKATDAKKFVFGLPAYFFKKAAPVPQQTHAESKISSLALTPNRNKQE